MNPDLELAAAKEATRALARRSSLHRIERRGPGRRSRSDLEQLLRGDAVAIETGQEFRAYGGSISSGCSGIGWENTHEGRVWSRPDLPHLVILDAPALSDGWEVLLTGFTERLTIDHYLAILWIISRLSEAAHWQDARGFIDLGDVAEAIYPDLRKNQTRATREATRRLVWEAMRYGAAARVRGDRSHSTYKKPGEGKRKPVEVPTRIDAPLWMIGGRETPAQKSLFGDDTELPLKAEIVLSAQWAQIITDPRRRQFVNEGERLGRIAPGKPGGALARSVGLALFELWRRGYGRGSDSFTVPRSELWSKYPPAKGCPDEYLSGNDPARALSAWSEALNWLAEVGLIDAQTARDASAKPKTGRGVRWSEAWRSEHLIISPAASLHSSIWPERMR